jgi:hypothetical protein
VQLAAMQLSAADGRLVFFNKRLDLDYQLVHLVRILAAS